jgi:glycosyltransferase involved in cell wall biosynthesis
MGHKTLLVIIPDRISDILKKGEYTPRYYNPGELFNEVHLLLTNNDRPDKASVQKTVGNAILHLHNLPMPSFKWTMGWQFFLVKESSPCLVRTHNNFIQGYLAKEIKKILGVPYVVSLHGVWDRDDLNTTKDKIIKIFRKKLEKISLQHADAVIAVYGSIIRYAKAYGAKNVYLVYNIVAGDNIPRKGNYKLGNPPRMITINRQTKDKNPEKIIHAIRDMNVYYLIVGDGEYHEYLRKVIHQVGCEGKVELIRSIPNEKLCEMLKDFDMMVSHCNYWGMSKTIIEAALAGLPIVINKHPAEPIPEYKEDWILLNENSSEGYRQTILTLIKNDGLRVRYGQNAYQYAKDNFDPIKMENKVVEIYRNLINSRKSR